MSSFYFFLITGIILIALEITTATFYLLVIGVAFVISSLFALKFNDWSIVTGIACVLAILGCLLIKVYKRKHNNNGKMSVEHIGQIVEITEIDNGSYRVLYSGSYWSAKLKNNSSYIPKVGDKLKITKFANNQLEIDVIG